MQPPQRLTDRPLQVVVSFAMAMGAMTIFDDMPRIPCFTTVRSRTQSEDALQPLSLPLSVTRALYSHLHTHYLRCLLIFMHTTHTHTHTLPLSLTFLDQLLVTFPVFCIGRRFRHGCLMVFLFSRSMELLVGGFAK